MCDGGDEHQVLSLKNRIKFDVGSGSYTRDSCCTRGDRICLLEHLKSGLSRCVEFLSGKERACRFDRALQDSLRRRIGKFTELLLGDASTTYGGFSNVVRVHMAIKLQKPDTLLRGVSVVCTSGFNLISVLPQ